MKIRRTRMADTTDDGETRSRNAQGGNDFGVHLKHDDLPGFRKGRLKARSARGSKRSPPWHGSMMR